MPSLDEVLATLSADVAPEADYLHDHIQFEIDEDLRIITIPDDGVVAGVVGDKKVNHINFKMVRYYNGFDMSEFTARVKYINAGGEGNLYISPDLTVEDDYVLFTWLLDSDVTAYMGRVAFVVNMIKTTSDGTIEQSFNTANNQVLQVLEGIEVDTQITPEEETDIASKLLKVLEDRIDSDENVNLSKTNAANIEKLKTQINETSDNLDQKIQDSNNTLNNTISNLKTQMEDNDSLALEDIDKLKTQLQNTDLTLMGKIDGGFVGDDDCLYLTADDEVVVGPLGPFAGTGGSGGGQPTNNAVLTLNNTTGWLSQTIGQDNKCVLKVNWSSLENDMSTGPGTATIRVNGALKKTLSVEQGDISIDVTDVLGVGSNRVKLTITDVYENTRTINFSVSVITISIRSSFDTSVVYNDSVNFTYVPIGDVEKTVHFVLDGTEIGTAVTTSSGRQQTYIIPKQSHGVHSIRCYLTCEMSGNEVRSNELYFEFISVESGNNNPIISSSYLDGEVDQYTSLPITYKVYDPTGLRAAIKLYINDEKVNELFVDRSQQTWVYRADKIGEFKLKIEVTNDYTTVSKTWTFNVVQSSVVVKPTTDNLSLYLSSYGRSNNEANPGTWKYNSVETVFNNFNFVSDGWVLDNKNITTLRVAGGATLEIPLKLFGSDFRATGKTIEFEFSTSEIMDYDAVILSCMSDNVGVELTAQKATLKSEQSEVFTQYKEDEHVRISFVVEKRSENRLIYVYINGNMSGVVRYPTDDNFAQSNPVNITIGNKNCVINLYTIRVYDNDLTRHQMLDNWIADKQDVDELLYNYKHNDVYNAYGEIIIDKLPKDLPYIVLQAEQLPTYKGDKKIIKGYYVDPTDPSKNFSFEGAEIDVQGTSSAGYERKNFKIKFKNGFIINGQTVTKYAFRGEELSIPVSTFCFKADVASSEGANNVELVRLYDDICVYQTPLQKEDSRARQGIDGFPIVMFQDNGTTTKFVGKYNFNNDKSNEDIFGFQEGDECWEILNNTSSRVNWKSADYTDDEWLNDFEGRYPDGNTDPTNLSALAAWIVSTDQSTATGTALSSSVIYDDITYTTDSAEYRLAKFKNEVTNWINKEDLLFYYLFTELFLMVDSRAKNAFPTRFNGEKWCFFPYDFDTAIGINNEGALVFSYELEDIDKVDGANVYNGQDSVLWVNTRQAFFNDLAKMYQTLRAGGVLSYDEVERRFEEHQSKWPEAIFNEDSWYKYLAPLVEKNNGSYLSMLQGSKAEQRKWWLYNRFRYMDSKYNAGDALADYVMIRAYAKDNITVEPYADIYATVRYGSYDVRKRALRGQSYTLECPLEAFNDTECYIYSAPQLKSIGDLSGLKVGYADFSRATRLQELRLGSYSDEYTNPNLKELYVGNNKLLKRLYVPNCINFSQTVDLSACLNLEMAYFDGTKITGVNLPNGGVLDILTLPNTMKNLTIKNQPKLAGGLSIADGTKLTTLVLENAAISYMKNILENFTESSARIRLIGFDWSFDSIDDYLTFQTTYLDIHSGLDENGNNTDIAQLEGIVRVPSITGAQLAAIKEKYPGITVIYEHITSYLYFYNYDGSTLLQTIAIQDGGDGSYSGSSTTRPSTAQYTYTFVGWALVPNSTSANANALKKITADRKVYAAFTSTIRKYSVYFYNGTTLLQTVSNVPYGGSATYTGDTPVSSEDSSLGFLGWSPTPTNITGNTSCYAQFEDAYQTVEITDSWDDIAASFVNKTYATKYKRGNYKKINEHYSALYYPSETQLSQWIVYRNDESDDRLGFFTNKGFTADQTTDFNGPIFVKQDDNKYMFNTLIATDTLILDQLKNQKFTIYKRNKEDTKNHEVIVSIAFKSDLTDDDKDLIYSSLVLGITRYATPSSYDSQEKFRNLSSISNKITFNITVNADISQLDIYFTLTNSAYLIGHILSKIEYVEISVTNDGVLDSDITSDKTISGIIVDASGGNVINMNKTSPIVTEITNEIVNFPFYNSLKNVPFTNYSKTINNGVTTVTWESLGKKWAPIDANTLINLFKKYIKNTSILNTLEMKVSQNEYIFINPYTSILKKYELVHDAISAVSYTNNDDGTISIVTEQNIVATNNDLFKIFTIAFETS